MFGDVEIPYGGYWSTPFAKWQGAFAHLHALRFAAAVARRELDRRDIAPERFDHAVLGTTIPQFKAFYGTPWVMSMIGADGVAGPTVAQACQTGPRCLVTAAREVASGDADLSLVITCDRTSNGAVLHYPGDGSRGGLPMTEAWVTDGFDAAPDLGHPMVRTAENVAGRWCNGRAEQDDVTLLRYGQYAEAVADNHAFQRRYMTLPFDVPDRSGRRVAQSLSGDVGVSDTSRAAVERLAPVTAGGTVTFAGQTHPADGNAAIIVASATSAREVSRDRCVRIRIRSFAQARVEPAFMPAAPVPAARRALARAELSLDGIDAFKSHNPFVVNDIVFSRETGVAPDRMNRFGSSLVFGHPQGPTGTRLLIELIEELVLRGGGRGLYFGCAAGDCGFAVVLEVEDRRAV